MRTLSTLGTVQLERTRAFPDKFADNPWRALALDAVQRRNATLDAVFYDVGVIRGEETHELAFWLAREGAVVAVPPSSDGKVEVFLTAEAFVESGRPAAALVVAGVGSSALGAAAFARNVADALGEPVAAVVSGYGLADVLTEALGGFFWFGALNGLRHLFEPLDDATKRFTRSEQATGSNEIAAWTRSSRDTRTVIALLEDARFRPRLLVGHSKGNLVVSEALYAIENERPDIAAALAARTRIVTISAKIGMPSRYRAVLDVMGEWDWFGALNSRPDIAADHTVPGAWHSTNPDFPLGMGIRVTPMLKAVLPMFETGLPLGAKVRPARFLDAPQIFATALRPSPGRVREGRRARRAAARPAVA